MVENPQLAIVIPTYRWNALAKDVLTQAASIGSDEIVVHIGDNSANPEKHAFLESLAARNNNVAVTYHPTNIGADANWLHLIKAQTAPYICMAADDDCFGGSYYRSALALIRDNPDCSAAAGLFVCVAHVATRDAPFVEFTAERREADPLKRVRNYRGANALCYAITRRSVIRDFASYVEANPLQCPFNDYMLAFHLLSMGAYRTDRRGYVYVFDNSRWQLNDAFIASNSRWYKEYNLPQNFGYLTRLHWAVVAVHFFLSVFRSPDLTDKRAAAIVRFLFNQRRTEFARDFYRYKQVFDALFEAHADAAAACARLMTNKYDHIATIFDDFSLVVGVFSPDVARRYREFQTATLLPKAERISFSAPGFQVAFERIKETAGRPFHRVFG